MGFTCGIVGLPNVGKSTLFNALTRTAAAQAANYPFCTIEPNTGEVAVPDPRLDAIAAIAKPAQIVPTRISFVDIAGLVRGASKGEGLGNQFLANIREVDAIVHVLRCFEGGDVTHVEGRVDPVADAETVNTELMLADLASLERRVTPLRKRAQTGDKEAKAEVALMDAALAVLDAGKPARTAEVPASEEKAFARPQPPHRQAGPLRRQCRGGLGRDRQRALGQGRGDGEGRGRRLRRHLGGDRGRDRAAARRRAARVPRLARPRGARPRPADPRRLRAPRPHHLLHRRAEGGRAPGRSRPGTRAPQAAGVIHTDFEKGFIRAQTIAYDDFIRLGGEQAAKEAGKARDEGKEYVVEDGDLLLFKFNV